MCHLISRDFRAHESVGRKSACALSRPSRLAVSEQLAADSQKDIARGSRQRWDIVRSISGALNVFLFAIPVLRCWT
jgi:hypothetical protein